MASDLNINAYLKARPDIVAHAQYGRLGSTADSDKIAREHFRRYGINEGVIGGEAYERALSGLSEFERRTGDIRGAEMDEELRKDLLNSSFEKEYGGGMSKAELQDFESLIGRLESSKMRQAAQGDRARQRDTYGGGLASMMRNF